MSGGGESARKVGLGDNGGVTNGGLCARVVGLGDDSNAMSEDNAQQGYTHTQTRVLTKIRTQTHQDIITTQSP